MRHISIRSKQKFDLYVGTLLALFFEFMAFVTGLVLRRNHKNVPFERILIMKFQGIGSLACAYPSILLLKNTFPATKFIFWGSKQTVSLARELNVFHSILELEESSYFASCLSLIRSLRVIWRFRPQWVFDLEIYSKLSSVLSLLTLGMNRVGFVSGTTRFRKHLHTHLYYFNKMHYVGDLYKSMLLGEVPHEVKSNMDGFTVAAEYSNYAKGLNISASLNDSRRPVIININSGELSSQRKWPPESFSAIINKLLDDYKFEIILTGNADESAMIDNLLAGLSNHGAGRVKNAAGLLTLRELLELLANGRLLLTNDSGPLHLAVLMGTPVVALFGPTHPLHILPERNEKIVAIYHNFICSPCIHVIDSLPCNGLAPCMRSISVDEVYEKINSILSNCPVTVSHYQSELHTKIYDRA